MQLKRNDDTNNDNVVGTGSGEYYGDASANSSVNERTVNFGANGPYESSNPYGALSMSGLNQPGAVNQPGGMDQSQGMGSPYRPGQPGGVNQPSGMGQPQGMGSPYRPGQPGGVNQPGGMGQPQAVGTPYRPTQEPIIHKKGINPLFIILPIVLLVVIFFASQFNKIFGKSKYIPGTYSEGILTNEYFGFKVDCTGSNWTTNGYSGDADAEQRALDADSTVEEYYAENQLSIEIMGFDVCQTPYNVKEAGTDVSALMESYKDDYVRRINGTGYKVTSITQDKMTIAGKTYDGYLITCDYSEGGQTVKVSMVQFYVFKGNYMGCFSAASTSEGKAKLVIQNHVSKLD